MDESTKDSVGDAITMGGALAMILSWSRNQSILYAMAHGLCSWIYVIYFAITRK